MVEEIGIRTSVGLFLFMTGVLINGVYLFGIFIHSGWRSVLRSCWEVYFGGEISIVLGRDVIWG